MPESICLVRPCGCKVTEGAGGYELHYCPLHLAAEELRRLLTTARKYVRGNAALAEQIEEALR